jgi:hypothetical protein
MSDRLSVKRIRFEGEGRYIIVVMVDRQKRSDPFMHTSDLADPLSKDEAMDKLREMVVPESEIQRLMAQAESSPA